MRIFSGIQPTGAKHLGNYSGGFRQYAATQEEGDGFFCIVDLHSITVDYDPEALRSSTLDLAAMLFATGLAVWALEKLPDDVKVDTVLLMSSALSPTYDLSKARITFRYK